jgi:hypothetical protein
LESSSVSGSSCIGQLYTSPDGTLRAIVVTTLAGESRTSIQLAPDRSLLTRDERSQDGAHGHRVMRAAWTADSLFLVVSTEASGGHQPWSRPIWVYSTAKNRIFELWRLGLVVTGEFTLEAPDRVEAPIIGCGGLQANGRVLAFSLSRMVSTRTIRNPRVFGPLGRQIPIGWVAEMSMSNPEARFGGLISIPAETRPYPKVVLWELPWSLGRLAPVADICWTKRDRSSLTPTRLGI